MTRRPDQSPNYRLTGEGPPAGPEPLPADFELPLREIDARLREHAEEVDVPDGLAERVMTASASLLPKPRPMPRRRQTVEPARGWRQWRLPSRRQWRGHLAMAASLGLAFVVAAVYLSRPAGAVEPPSGLETALAADIEWPLEQVDRELSYLLETGALYSEDDVTGEIWDLFPELDL